MNKKGNIGTLYPTILTLILAAMLIGAGMLVLGQMTTALYSSTTSTVVNESTVIGVKEAGATLAPLYRDAACSITWCINATNSLTVPTANYTKTNCKVAWSAADIDATGNNNSIWKCNYQVTYKADTAASNGTLLAVTSLATIPTTWLPVLIVVIIAGLIIVYLSGALGGKQK